MNCFELKKMKKDDEKQCCMCGDTGFSRELFQCRICLHRSQHTYCSCLYPTAESYQVCDWCLRNGEERKASKIMAMDSRNVEKPKIAQHLPDHLSSQSDPKKQQYRANGGDRQRIGHFKKLKSMPERLNQAVGTANQRSRCFTSAKAQKLDEPPKNRTISSPRNAMHSCKDSFRIKIGVSKASTPRLVRGKVRRYKLLEEVSS